MASTWGAAVLAAAIVAVVGGALVPALVPADPVPATQEYFAGTQLSPEPREQATFLALLLFPVLVVGLATLLLRRRPSADTTLLAGVTMQAQALAVALVAVCWLVQLEYRAYFDLWQGIAAVAGALVAGALVAAPPGRRPDAPALRRLVPGPRGAVAIAVLAVVAGVSFSVFRGGNVVDALGVTVFHLPYVLDEVAAVAAGQAPAVDFTAQYTFVLPYLLSPIFALAGPSVLAFTVTMAALTAVALLAVFWVFRRITGGPARALALFLPFVSFTLFPAQRMGEHVHNVATYWSLMPMRYLGPFVTLALLVWAVGRPTRRRVFCLGLAAALTLCNNTEFGFAAFVAAGLALACTRPDPGRDAAAAFAAGAALAIAIFAGLTLVWSGGLPNPVDMTAFARQFAAEGFFLLPIASIFGLHLIGFATYAACFVVGTMRGMLGVGLRSAEDRERTAALAFAGIFGLGSAGYYVGRSDPEVLIGLFGPWSVALLLLAWETWRHVREVRPEQALQRLAWVLPAALIAGHVVLIASTLAWDRAIADQPARLLAGGQPRLFEAAQLSSFVRDCSPADEPVGILHPLGKATALRTGADDVTPFSSPNAIVSFSQLEQVMRVYREHDVRRVFLDPLLAPEIRAELERAGYAVVAERPAGSVEERFIRVTGSSSLLLLTRAVPPEQACPRASR